MPKLTKPFSGTGKIVTNKDMNNVYVLDSGNNRILVISKQGHLVQQIKSNQFNTPEDFSVDEKNKVIFVLNDGSLQKLVNSCLCASHQTSTLVTRLNYIGLPGTLKVSSLRA